MERDFECSLFGGETLPLVIRPTRAASTAQFLERLRRHASALRQRLAQHGGILLRGCPIEGPEDFAGAVDALASGPPVHYIGGDSPRRKVFGAVYTSTEAPPGFKIPLHNELSFSRSHPKQIFFYCEVAPAGRGETILGDARRVYRALDPAVRERFVRKQLRYVSCYYGKSWLIEHVNPSHKSWRDVFETDDRSRVEQLCREHGFAFEWTDDNWIRIGQTRPAAIVHPETGDWVWFSQPHLYDFNPRLLGAWRFLGAKLFYARPHTRLHEVAHADGSKIARADLYHLMDTLDANTVAFRWQRGDVLMLDNLLAMHGRAPFSGPRRILAALTG